MALKSKRTTEIKKFYAPCLVENNGDVILVFETVAHETGQVLNGVVVDGPGEIGTRVEIYPGTRDTDCKPFYGDITISQYKHNKF